MSFSVPSHSALLLVDIQYDFLPGGALAITDGEKILPVVYDLLDTRSNEFELIVASLDWHPRGHVLCVHSFQAAVYKYRRAKAWFNRQGCADAMARSLRPKHKG